MRHKQVNRLLAAAILMVGAAACGDDETEPDAESTADAVAATTAETVAATATEQGEAATTTAPAATTTAPAADTTAPAPAPTTAAAADDDGGTPGSLSEALAAEIISDEELEGGPISDPVEAACWADAIVSGVGEDRLTELGMTVESVGELEDYEFDDGEIDVVVESLFDCTDVKQAFAESFSADFDAETVQCLADGLDDDWLKDLFRFTLADADAEPPPEFEEEFSAILVACGVDPDA